MGIESGQGTPSAVGRTLIEEDQHDESDHYRLLIDEDGFPTVEWEEIQDYPGRFEMIHADPDAEVGIAWTAQTYNSVRMAALAYGLWDLCGPFDQPESGRAIPLEVAREGQNAIAAYLRIGGGHERTTDYVASQMAVSKQSVWNYCSQIRWSPE